MLPLARLTHAGIDVSDLERSLTLHQHGLTHPSFRVTDLDAVLASLRAEGEHVREDTIIGFPEWRSAACFIADPDGHLIEFVEAPGDPAVSPRA